MFPRLDAVSPEDWRRLFPSLPDPLELVQFVQRCGMDGFTFQSVVVKQQDRTILCVPVFETVYNISSFLDGQARTMASAAARWLPRILCPRVLGVGFVEGEWGQIGYEPRAHPEILRDAWDLALEALHQLAEDHRIDLMAFVNFTSESGRMVPVNTLKQFTPMVSLPYGRVPITYNSIDEYLASLSKGTRKDIRRKIRSAEGMMDIRRTREPGPWRDTIYQWYRDAVQRGDAVFGVQRRDYFEQVCDVVPGAEYVCYVVKGQLAAFNLVVVRPDCLIDKYFGMDPVLGRKHQLYFLSWIENIRYCIAHHIPLYHAGQGAEATKQRLGAQLLPSLILFHHRNPIIHSLLRTCLKPLAYQPSVELPVAQLGLGWVESRGANPLGVETVLESSRVSS